MKIRAIDGHLHGDILLYCSKEFPKKYGSLRIGGINWAYSEKISTIEGYVKYWDELSSITKKLGEITPFFYMVGIHPRTICGELEKTKTFPKPLRDSLRKHLTSPMCLGIGEIGLETGDLLQETILRFQLEFACSYLPEGKKIGIHTPRKNKEKITERILRILEDYPQIHEHILLEHMNLSTLSIIKDMEPVIGMTLQEGKISPADIKHVIESHLYPIGKIILNSDGGKSLSLPYIDFIEKGYVKEQDKEKLLKENICQFYSIPL